MGSPAEEPLLTVEHLYDLPDDGRIYELEAGHLLSEPLPAPRHGRVAARLAAVLDPFVRRNGLGVVLSNDPGYVLGRAPDTVRGPDVSFVTRARYQAIADETRAFPGPPDLAIEVVSPSDPSGRIRAKARTTSLRARVWSGSSIPSFGTSRSTARCSPRGSSTKGKSWTAPTCSPASA